MLRLRPPPWLQREPDITQEPLLSPHDLNKIYASVKAHPELWFNLEATLYDQQAGEHQARNLGVGFDYAETRVFQTGDDLRHMDWRRTARTAEPHVKVFKQEQRPSVAIVMDRRVSMRFGTHECLKVTQAAKAATALAYAATEARADIFGLTIESRLKEAAPAHGWHALDRLIEQFIAPAPPMWRTQAQVSMRHTLEYLCSCLRKSTALFLISDLMDLHKDCVPQLQTLAKDRLFRIIGIRDTAELDLPTVGVAQLTDMHETIKRWDTDSPVLAQTFADLARQHFARIETLTRSAGLVIHWMETGDDALNPLGHV